mgnify:CR=1 FL=1
MQSNHARLVGWRCNFSSRSSKRLISSGQRAWFSVLVCLQVPVKIIAERVFVVLEDRPAVSSLSEDEQRRLIEQNKRDAVESWVELKFPERHGEGGDLPALPLRC